MPPLRSTRQRSSRARRSALSGCILILIAWDEERRRLVDSLRALGLSLLVLAIEARETADAPAWVRLLRPGSVQQGLSGL